MISSGGYSCDIPTIDVEPDQSKHEAKLWLGKYRHLRTREKAITADLGSGPSCEALRGRDVSTTSAAAGDLQRLRVELWSQVDTARTSVRAITNLLSHARPSGAAVPVEQLAAAIDTAETILERAAQQQCAVLADLYQQEAQLEADIESIGSRLDADLLADAARSAAAAAGGQAAAAEGRSEGRVRPISAGTRRPGSQSRQRRLSTGGWVGGGGGAAVARGSSGGGGGGGGSGGGSLAPEVQAYDDFLAEHGPTGGWDPEDHTEFIAILQSCGGDYSTAAAIVAERTIGFTRADVVGHARWHMELMELEAAKRAAVERWRASRVAARAAVGKVAEQALQSDTAELAQRERQRDQQSRDQQVLLTAAKREIAARWRAEREERQRAAAEAAAQRAAAETAARRAEVEARQAAAKQQLQAVKAAKERQRREAEARAAAETALRSALTAPTAQQLQRVAHRSVATFTRRLSLRAAAEAKQQQRERVQQQLLEKVRVEVPTDPSRLLRGTAAHMQRIEAVRAEERAPRDSGFILHVASRVTPSWRAGLAGG